MNSVTIIDKYIFIKKKIEDILRQAQDVRRGYFYKAKK